MDSTCFLAPPHREGRIQYRPKPGRDRFRRASNGSRAGRASVSTAYPHPSDARLTGMTKCNSGDGLALDYLSACGDMRCTQRRQASCRTFKDLDCEDPRNRFAQRYLLQNFVPYVSMPWI